MENIYDQQYERPQRERQPAYQQQPAPYGPPQVVVTDIRMPFWSMVGFMIKWAFASIPAMIILSIVAFGFVVLGSIALAALGGLAR